MNGEIFTIIGVGMALGLFIWRVSARLDGRIDRLEARFDGRIDRIYGRLDGLVHEMHELAREFAELRGELRKEHASS